MKKTIFAFLTIALMIFIVYSLFAQNIISDKDYVRPGLMGMGRMGRGGPGMGFGQMAFGMAEGRGLGMFRADLMEKIDLTKEQKETIQKILSEHKKDIIKKDADQRLAEVELQEMLSREKPDMGLVKNQIQKIANLKADIQFARIKMQIDLKNVLTDEQKAKIEKLIQDQKAEMKEKMKDIKSKKDMNKPSGRQRGK